MSSYSFNEKSQFVIKDYDKAKTFASFLPGVAGVDGIPMWSFYVNRGQGMGSFGVKDKNSTIMEFMPASTMYKNIELNGFRTFVKYNNEIHEIFSSASRDQVERNMYIEKNLLKVEEINKTLNIRVLITYFTMPKESFAAIVRKVEVENLEEAEKAIELLDGLVQVLPFGVTNSDYQAMANLMRAWFDVFNLEEDIAYYKVRATTSDSAEVGEVNKGNFYLSFSSESNGLIKPIADMDVIFGSNTSLTYPANWNCSLKELAERKQVFVNKVSGGFTPASFTLKDRFTLVSVIGHISSPELINNRKADFTLEYIEKKEAEARELVEVLVKDIDTETSNKLFDEYMKQCYLDNILRGGYPLVFKAGEKNFIYHVFSRKHGDLEREYNFFSVEPAYYSQGNGNFRDVNQNRRSDVLFKPEVEAFNVKQFMSLIQADGYNPLVVKGSTFKVKKDALKHLLTYVEENEAGILNILSKAFTPGELISYIVDKAVKLKISKEEFLSRVLESSKQSYEAEFGEGFWIDHWTYNMDLIETYLSIYPDRLEEFTFEDGDYKFFDSPERVLPRSDKYVIVDNKVRQYGAIQKDKEKCETLNLDAHGTNWLRTDNGRGEIYTSNLYVKLVSLALNKFVGLDPFGMGIEMEANKPGWNDAMNGLPGIFGSAINETAELKRVVDFIVELSAELDKQVKLPEEIAELLNGVINLLISYNGNQLDDYNYWDKINSLKEAYREKIRFGISGQQVVISTKALLEAFKAFQEKLEKGLDKALELGNGIYPTYLYYEAKSFDIIEGKKNPVNGYQNVSVKEFEVKALPLFLEGPARALKVIKDKSKAKELYEKIKQSEIYDRKLKMYKTSVPLDDTTHEIGRARAFTAGWLEREAVFMHMEYKYLLELIKAGLYEEYYEDIKTMLVPFLNPEMYGRSTLENSSFIASSVNPDEAVHGRGFVARLSGSTAEMLSMWFNMMVGNKVFTYENGELNLTFRPILTAEMFEAGKLSFNFLGDTKVTYYNPKELNTFGEKAAKIINIELSYAKGETIKVSGDTIKAPYSGDIRSGLVESIKVYMD